MARTIIFSTGQPYSGLANYVINLIPQFKKNKFNVDVYHFVYWKKKYFINGATPLYGFNPLENSWLINDILGIRERKLMSVVTKDVNRIHFPEPMGLPSAGCLRKLRKRNVELVCTVRDMIDATIGKYNYHVDDSEFVSFIRRLFRRDPESRSREEIIKLSLMDKIICISEYTRKDLKRMFKRLRIRYDSSRIFVAYHGINHDVFRKLGKSKAVLRKMFKLPVDKIILISNSSEEPRKNIGTLYRALKLLPKNYVLVRNGHVSETNRKLIEELGLKDRIIFFKGLPYQEYAELLNAADIFVLPTTYEGFCNPPVEAGACGLPVITTHKTSLKEVIRDSAIILNDPYSAENLRDKIIMLAEDKAMMKRYADLAHENSLRFDWEKDCRETIAVYKKKL